MRVQARVWSRLRVVGLSPLFSVEGDILLVEGDTVLEWRILEVEEMVTSSSSAPEMRERRRREIR